MIAIRRRLLPATARQLYRDAGPPTIWVLAAFVTAGATAALIASQSFPAAPIVAVVVAIGIVAIPSALDVDGWQIRFGMAWLALEQRRRSAGLPRTPAEAERWLEASGADAPPLERVSALIMAGRSGDARSVLDGASQTTLEDRVRVARIRASLDGLDGGAIDPGPILGMIGGLPPDVARYHRISLAWSTAWVDRRARRPWRQRFAVASRGIRPGELPLRALARISFDELLAPIAVAVTLIVIRAIGWL